MRRNIGDRIAAAMGASTGAAAATPASVGSTAAGALNGNLDEPADVPPSAGAVPSSGAGHRGSGRFGGLFSPSNRVSFSLSLAQTMSADAAAARRRSGGGMQVTFRTDLPAWVPAAVKSQVGHVRVREPAWYASLGWETTQNVSRERQAAFAQALLLRISTQLRLRGDLHYTVHAHALRFVMRSLTSQGGAWGGDASISRETQKLSRREDGMRRRLRMVPASSSGDRVDYSWAAYDVYISKSRAGAGVRTPAARAAGAASGAASPAASTAPQPVAAAAADAPPVVAVAVAAESGSAGQGAAPSTPARAPADGAPPGVTAIAVDEDDDNPTIGPLMSPTSAGAAGDVSRLVAVSKLLAARGLTAAGDDTIGDADIAPGTSAAGAASASAAAATGSSSADAGSAADADGARGSGGRSRSSSIASDISDRDFLFENPTGPVVAATPIIPAGATTVSVVTTAGGAAAAGAASSTSVAANAPDSAAAPTRIVATASTTVKPMMLATSTAAPADDVTASASSVVVSLASDEKDVLILSCKHVTVQRTVKGACRLTTHQIIVVPDPAEVAAAHDALKVAATHAAARNGVSSPGGPGSPQPLPPYAAKLEAPAPQRWSLALLVRVLPRRHILQRLALEFFFADGTSLFLAFSSPKHRTRFYTKLVGLKLPRFRPEGELCAVAAVRVA